MDIIIPSLILITFNMTGEVPYQLLQQLYTSLLSFRMIKNLSKVCQFFENMTYKRIWLLYSFAKTASPISQHWCNDFFKTEKHLLYFKQIFKVVQRKCKKQFMLLHQWIMGSSAIQYNKLYLSWILMLQFVHIYKFHIFLGEPDVIEKLILYVYI
jgi:hypothetical protein